jgi:type II secretory pathway predicted ATPase ExeA
VYRDHYGLKERPFIHAPGKRFFAAGTSVSEAVARLVHVLTARDAISLVTGGPGVGKSTLAECAIAELGDRVTAVRVDLRFSDADDIYNAILLALGEDAGTLRPVQALGMLRQKMAHMVRADQHLVLCLDIGGISTEVAKHLLRVANAAGERDCQLNIVLMGPHQLHQQLDLPALIQLRQRIAFRYRVRPLSLADTDRYIRHQLEAVGGDPANLLSGNLSAAVYCYVAGVPRLINTLLDAALTEGCLQKVQRPDGNLVRRTAEGLGWKPLAPPAGADAQKSEAAAKPAPVRSSPPKVAVISSGAADRDRPRAVEATPAARRPDLPPASDMTLQLRRGSTAASLTSPSSGDPGSTGRFAALSLASESKSPTAAIFGAAESKPAAAAPLIPMDDVDTSATGMLRLQDLDERFAETIFGRDESADRKRD